MSFEDLFAHHFGRSPDALTQPPADGAAWLWLERLYIWAVDVAAAIGEEIDHEDAGAIAFEDPRKVDGDRRFLFPDDRYLDGVTLLALACTAKQAIDEVERLENKEEGATVNNLLVYAMEASCYAGRLEGSISRQLKDAKAREDRKKGGASTRSLSPDQRDMAFEMIQSIMGPTVKKTEAINIAAAKLKLEKNIKVSTSTLRRVFNEKSGQR